MSAVPRIQVITVYSSGTRKAAARGGSNRVLGAVSLLVAAVWLYVLWFHVDPFLSQRYNLSLPIGAFVDLNQMFSKAPANVADPAPPKGTEAAVKSSHSEGGESDHRPTVEAASRYTAILTGLMLGWEFLATTAGLTLAMAGGAAVIGASTARQQRSRLWVYSLLILIGIAAYGFTIWRQYRMGWEVRHVHLLIGGLAVFFALLGAACSFGGRGLHRMAAYVILLSALSSMVGLGWANHLNAFEPGWVTASVYAQVFLVQAVYAVGIIVFQRAVLPVRASSQ